MRLGPVRRASWRPGRWRSGSTAADADPRAPPAPLRVQPPVRAGAGRARACGSRAGRPTASSSRSSSCPATRGSSPCSSTRSSSRSRSARTRCSPASSRPATGTGAARGRRPTRRRAADAVAGAAARRRRRVLYNGARDTRSTIGAVTVGGGAPLVAHRRPVRHRERGARARRWPRAHPRHRRPRAACRSSSRRPTTRPTGRRSRSFRGPGPRRGPARSSARVKADVGRARS